MRIVCKLMRWPVKKKKFFSIVFAVILAVLVVFIIVIFSMFRNELNAIKTIKKISDDKNLYTMEYNGDYGFEAFLEAGGASSDNEVAKFLSRYISKGYYTYDIEGTKNGCSTIAAVNSEGKFMFGRNFDWIDCTSMIVKTKPEKGYASISTVNLDFLGYNKDYQPSGIINSFLALGAPFVPLDGMNEMGLCIADLIIEDAGETHQNTEKIDLTTTTAIRLILDNAATVEEAINLLEQYDMHSSNGAMHHLAIADSYGNSVVVEYIDNEMYVTPTQFVTNFFLTDGKNYGFGSESSKIRFNILSDIYNQNNGVLEEDDIKSALISVCQSKSFDPGWISQWSIVFNQSDKKIKFYHYEDYDKEYVFSID